VLNFPFWVGRRELANLRGVGAVDALLGDCEGRYGQRKPDYECLGARSHAFPSTAAWSVAIGHRSSVFQGYLRSSLERLRTTDLRPMTDSLLKSSPISTHDPRSPRQFLRVVAHALPEHRGDVLDVGRTTGDVAAENDEIGLLCRPRWCLPIGDTQDPGAFDVIIAPPAHR